MSGELETAINTGANLGDLSQAELIKVFEGEEIELEEVVVGNNHYDLEGCWVIDKRLVDALQQANYDEVGALVEVLLSDDLVFGSIRFDKVVRVDDSGVHVELSVSGGVKLYPKESGAELLVYRIPEEGMVEG